jgi:TetR/AcrR family transcriptional regulator, repressor for uid operon
MRMAAPTDPGALLERALDPTVEPPPDDALSGRILDAALALSAASGVRNLTMDDVASRAGVGRMTVYRRFGDKSRLVEGLAVREARRCLAQLDAAANPDDPIEDQVAEGLVTSLRIAREHPLLNRLARHEPEAVLGVFLVDDSAVFRMARRFLAERLRASQRAGVLGPVDADEAAELLVRLTISFVLIQDSVLPLHDEARTREVARRLFAPVLVAAVG